MSQDAQVAVLNYQEKFSNTTLAKIESQSMLKLNSIIEQVADNNRATPGFDEAKFKADFFGLTEDPVYSKACENVFALHKASKESQDLISFKEEKQKATQNIVDEIKADLVSHTIKLNQLNELLPPEERLEPAAIKAYAGAAFGAYLKEYKLENNPSIKNQFLKDIDDSINKDAYQYSEAELRSFSDLKTQMRENLSEIGINSEIIPQTSSVTIYQGQQQLDKNNVKPKEADKPRPSSPTSVTEVLDNGHDLNVKRANPHSLNGYEGFTPEEIIAKGLISVAAKEGNLKAASFMVNAVSESKAEGKEAALKDGLSALITSFPAMAAEADKPREVAFSKLNALRKELANVDKLSTNDEKVIEIINRPDFTKSSSRLPSAAASENLKKAQAILKAEINSKIEEAEKTYQTEKVNSATVSKEFENTITQIASKIDITSTKLPKLDEYSAEQKDIIFRAIDQSKAKFAKPKINIQTKPKSNKTISEHEAAKSLSKELPPLSENVTSSLSNYKEQFSARKLAELESQSMLKLNEIVTQVADGHKDTPGFNANAFKQDFLNFVEDPTYAKACENIFELHKKSVESQALLEFREKKKETAQDLVDEIKADLVPIAIKLQQLNNHLPPEERLDSSELKAYMEASFSAYIKECGVENTPALKTSFLKDIDNNINKEAYQYSEAELKNISDLKAAMGSNLQKIGIKTEILSKTKLHKIQSSLMHNSTTSSIASPPPLNVAMLNKIKNPGRA